jgi:hypothetical protein
MSSARGPEEKNQITKADGRHLAVFTNPQCDKDADSVSLSRHCQLHPGRRKPPVRKTELLN